MHNLNNANINSPDYWDQVYINERGSGKRRIDNERLAFLVGALKDWHQYSPQIDRPEFLDVGCGDGELLRLLHANLPHWKKTGVDITPRTIDWAQSVDPQFSYRVANAYELPYPPDAFDAVFCGETLEHLENPELAVQEMFRVLKPGGYLVCSLPSNHNNYSPEHLNEFTVWDAMNMTTKGDLSRLVNIDVKCGGISIIWTTRK